MTSFWNGWLLGLAGLFPFVHVNLLLQTVPASAYGENSAVFAVALSFSHLAFSTLPTLLLYSVDGGQLAFSLQGRPKNPGSTLRLFLTTMLASMALSVAAVPALETALPWAYSRLAPHMAAVISVVIVAFLWTQRRIGRLGASAFVFAFSGLIGWGVFEWGHLHAPLFPLLTGLFAVPTLVLGESPVGIASETEDRISWKGLLGGVLLGAASTLVPALSVGAVLALAFLFLDDQPRDFVSLAYAVAASKTFFDFVAAGSIGKARSAAAALALQSGELTNAPYELGIAAVTALALASALGIWLAPYAATAMRRIDSERLRQAVLLVLLVLCGIWEGPAGIAALVAAGAVALTGELMGVKRGLNVGALMVPAWMHFAISV